MAKRRRTREVTKTDTKSIPHHPTNPAAPKRKSCGARQVTVYDAVASRAGCGGFIKSTLRKNEFGERHRRSQVAYPADEVLGRRKHAPEEPIPYDYGERETGLPDSVCVMVISDTREQSS